jgi:hypothetical protein
VASGQVLYGTGAGVAGSEAALFWDSANNRLGVGTNTPADLAQFESASGVQARLTIVAGATAQSPGLQLGWPGNTNAGIIRVDLAGANGGDLSIWAKATGSSVAEKMRVFGSGNVGIGTTADDGTNRLQVAGNMRIAANTPKLIMRDTASGTADFEFQASGNGLSFNRAGVAVLGTIDYLNGSFTWHNQTPTTGATQLIVRAGAGQSTTNLQTWQNSGGTAVASVASNGTLIATGIVTSSAVFNSTNDLALDAAAGFSVLLRPNGGSERVRVGDTFIRTRNSQVFQFSSDATSFGTPDMGWSRNSSTAIEVNNGTAGTFRDLYLRGVRPVGSTVANLPTASGNTGMIATVTDATVTTIGTTVAGGGGNTVLVWSNGTNWRIYAN